MVLLLYLFIFCLVWFTCLFLFSVFVVDPLSFMELTAQAARSKSQQLEETVANASCIPFISAEQKKKILCIVFFWFGGVVGGGDLTLSLPLQQFAQLFSSVVNIFLLSLHDPDAAVSGQTPSIQVSICFIFLSSRLRSSPHLYISSEPNTDYGLVRN